MAIVATYSARGITRLTGLNPGALAALAKARVVAPSDGHFGFQDLQLLRTVKRLQDDGVPTRTIVNALVSLQSTLPPGTHLCTVALRASGASVEARGPSGSTDASSGQRLLQLFEPDEAQRVTAPTHLIDDADSWLARGVSFEASDPDAAEEAYLHALSLDPQLTPAYSNLVGLLHATGRFLDAIALADRASQLDADSASLQFNVALSLEDSDQHTAALLAYQRAVDLDPDYADAHCNLALLAERQGQAQLALLHFNAYRRLAAAESELAQPPCA
jgi:tetratricopeptide (TPR) repeat protein